MSGWAEYGDGPIILHGRRRIMIVISETIVPRRNSVHRPDSSRPTADGSNRYDESLKKVLDSANNRYQCTPPH